MKTQFTNLDGYNEYGNSMIVDIESLEDYIPEKEECDGKCAECKRPTYDTFLNFRNNKFICDACLKELNKKK